MPVLFNTDYLIRMDDLNSLLDNLDEALIILDNEGKVHLCNEVAAKLSQSLFLRPLQEGIHLIDSINSEMILTIGYILQEIKLKNEAEKYYAECKNHNGTTVFLEFNFVPAINNEGIISYIYLVIRDITPQKVFE